MNRSSNTILKLTGAAGAAGAVDQRIVQAEPHLQKILIKKNTIKFRQRFSEFLFVHYGDSDDLISRL